MNPLLVLPATSFCLGCWQLYRLQWKLDLIHSLSNLNPTPLNPTNNQLAEFQLVSLVGKFQNGVELRVERPKTLEQKVTRGELVFQPFKLKESGDRVIVNRGWVPLHYSIPSSSDDSTVSNEPTRVLSEPTTVSNEPTRVLKEPIPSSNESTESIIGLIRKGEGFLMGQNRINIDEFAHKLDTLPILVEQVEQQQQNTQYPIQRSGNYLTNNHLEYAITWFALSASTLLLLRGKKHKMFKFYCLLSLFIPY